MSTRSTQRQWSQRKDGLGIMAARLMVAIQEELYERLAEAGHDQITYLHGAVIAHLDEEGNRATVLSRRSGRHKQIIGRLVDELEELGYVERHPEKVDRRGKKIVPTSKGLELMRLSDSIVADIESRQEELVGGEQYGAFRETLREVVDSLSNREVQ